MQSPTRFQHLLARVKENGYRATLQRVALLKIIETSTGHPSARQILVQMHKSFPTTTARNARRTCKSIQRAAAISKAGNNQEIDNSH